MKQEITVLNEKVRLVQPENGFRTSLDAVLLAAACPIKAGQSLLDAGCGVGSAGLCAAYRVKGVELSGIDIQADHVDIAQGNAALNNIEADYMVADIREYKREAGFHHVICNPPYLDTGAHLRSPHNAKATAMGHDNEMSTADWIIHAARLLKPEGTLTMVHAADKLDKILQAMEGRFGAVEVIPLWPKTGKAAKRVIVRGVKGRKTGAAIHTGLTLHENDGGYTLEADIILRNGEGLCL